MEVEENVLFKIRSLKAWVLMSRKQQYSRAAGPGKSSRNLQHQWLCYFPHGSLLVPSFCRMGWERQNKVPEEELLRL